MRTLVALGALLLVAIAAAVLGVLALALQDQPLISQTWRPTPTDIRRTRDALRRHDPRRFAGNGARTVSMGELDLNLIANHALSLLGEGGFHAEMREQALDIEATLLLLAPWRRYLNVQAVLRTTDADLPTFERLRVGGLRVPGWLADRMFIHALRWAVASRQHAAGGTAGILDPREYLKGVQIRRGSVQLTYLWPRDSLARLQSTLVGAEERARMAFYHDAVLEVATGARPGALPLTELLAPLFRLAESRSRGGDPIVENRALLVVLAAYASGRGLEAVLPEHSWPRSVRRRLSLHGRRDLAQHFLTSAGLAVMGGGALADTAGIFKEMDDSQGGSGFSFVDLAADRAGTRFGEKAVGSLVSATALQSALGALSAETDLMPEARDLPENLSDAELQRRFGGVGGRGYEQVKAEIEKRLERLALYRSEVP